MKEVENELDVDRPPVPVGVPTLADRQMAEGVRGVPAIYTDADRDRAASILLGSDNGESFLRHISEMAEKRQRSAQWAKLKAEILGWTGTKSQVLAWMVAQLGVSMLGAQTAIRQVQRAPRDPHEIARTCREYLGWYEGPNGPREDE